MYSCPCKSGGGGAVPFAWLVAGYSYAVESLRVPFAYRHTVVVIVGTHKDEDGIEIIAMFLLQLVSLSGNIVPLSAAHP